LATPPSSSGLGLGEAKLNARDNPYDSSNGTSASRNTRRGEDRDLRDDELNCFDIGTRYYVFRDYLADRVKEYCKAVDKKGIEGKDYPSITRIYYQWTKEAVKFEAFFQEDDAKGDYDSCEKALMSIIDDCSVADKKKNPHNVKAGGKKKVGDIIYLIDPYVGPRGDPIHAVGGGCKQTMNAAGTKKWKIWGHGWATWDNGKTIKDKLHEGNCHPSDKTFKWKNLNEVKDDNIEWEAHFSTWDDTEKNCIQDALGAAGGPTGTDLCTGAGK
ncbi:hypothetical protein IMZ48_18550, partial [Candidatus Bathyarchaeota archaeon]|nr:hypothetical protein [Candidatus Bathyarchaeota archaeon]